jgi:hypothetical protein
MPKRILNDEQQIYVVTELARFTTPTQVQGAIKKEWDVEMSLQAIEGYDPTTVQGAKLRPELRTLFYRERALAKKNIDSLGITHVAYRLRELQGVLDRAKSRKNDKMIMDVMQQAAREVGGSFTNKVHVQNDTPEPKDARRILADFLGVPLAALPVAKGHDEREGDEGGGDRDELATAPKKPTGAARRAKPDAKPVKRKTSRGSSPAAPTSKPKPAVRTKQNKPVPKEEKKPPRARRTTNEATT